MLKHAWFALALAVLAIPAFYLWRFDVDAALEPSPRADTRPRRAIAGTALGVRSLGLDGPLTVAPAAPKQGDVLFVRCRATDSLRGARSVVLRRTIDGASPVDLPMADAGGGFFAASVPTGSSTSRVGLLCFDPARRPARGVEGFVHLPSSEGAARLPRFPRRRKRAELETTDVHASMAFGDDRGPVATPMGKPVLFDRRTRSPALDYYWISQERSTLTSETAAALLDDAAADLKAYLQPAAADARPSIYVKRCAHCEEEGAPPAEYAGLACGEAITVVTSDADLLHTAVHEMTHFFTPGLERCHEHPQICEGLAVVAAGAYDGGLGGVQEEASRALKAGRGRGFLAMTREQFYAPDGLWERYMLSGSFTLFLVERRGIKPVLALIEGAPFKQAFGRPLAELEAEWRARLLAP